MNAQQLASAVLQILPRAQVPMTRENAHGTVALYQTLDAMVRGELVFSKPAAPEPSKD